ncbi:uncharacterized protein PHACADRAFT_262138 [Phanerochaete carnosa HHB-10118-sp]|uniref:Nucleolar protein 12 n=1 Tax=Phanerochaete carnosa (strain HHB-10118-sp) TaxID=650164 RepID=K5VYD7_PHACS|nr:uncharacterized protein PHACADRAFT_262138 [Phanerochaete carnosa HHB-10118-sp]EKM51795.1 hypothetical protein PHACADRAFT_262138 [Phanerochaete carnosa HHB-10118-sp]
MQKQFSRYILSFVPDAKIESIRFRSVAFQKPTTELPADNPSSKSMSKEGRQHDRDRAASWRASKGKDDDEEAAPAKTFLTPKEKKRIAFIKQEIHSGVDSVNAYIVFAHPVPAESRPKNLPPLKPIMDPYEAAKAAIRAADGSVFMDRTLRLDLAAKGKGKAREIVNAESPDDPKATIFVGNLDFAAKEEDVRVFFEGLVVTERGEPTEIQAEDAERSDEKAWVKRVRLIRDKDTLLGKGFGYVQFMDRECVDEILALEQDRLKFAKRKLRVQRCKTLPGASKVAPARPSAQTKTVVQTKGTSQTRSLPAAPAPVPKGDPSLGAKLAGLSKEERKKLKATDADRVARRLAKKKAKALADHGVKARESTKERVRERKRPMDKSGAAESSKSKKRVRSSKALAKMNMKK